MCKRLVFGCVLAAVVALGSPQPASAQVGGDLAVGYSFLTNDQLAANASNLPLGFFFDTSYQVNEGLSLAFDVNGHYRRGIEASNMYSGGPNDMPVRPNPNQDFQALSFNRPEQEYCSPLHVGEYSNLCQVHIPDRQRRGRPAFPHAGGRRPAVLPRAVRGGAVVAQDRLLRAHRDPLGDSARRAEWTSTSRRTRRSASRRTTA